MEGLPEPKVQKKNVANSASGVAIPDQPKDVEGRELDLAHAVVKDGVESTVLKADMNASIRRKKSVSFAEGTKEGDATIPKSRSTLSREQSKSQVFAGHDRVIY
jgi:hypothetical protein